MKTGQDPNNNNLYGNAIQLHHTPGGSSCRHKGTVMHEMAHSLGKFDFERYFLYDGIYMLYY